jgi:hypothetical protein
LIFLKTIFYPHPDSTDKRNTATFGKNISGGFKTQTLHRRRTNLAYNFIYLFPGRTPGYVDALGCFRNPGFPAGRPFAPLFMAPDHA